MSHRSPSARLGGRKYREQTQCRASKVVSYHNLLTITHSEESHRKCHRNNPKHAGSFEIIAPITFGHGCSSCVLRSNMFVQRQRGRRIADSEAVHLYYIVRLNYYARRAVYSQMCGSVLINEMHLNRKIVLPIN